MTNTQYHEGGNSATAPIEKPKRQMMTVRFVALTDVHTEIEVEASSPQQAIELAREQLADAPDWKLPDEGIEAIQDTEEPVSVRDEDDEEVLTLPTRSYTDIAGNHPPAPGFTDREIGTLLAALRFYQATIENGDADRLGDVADIASEGGTLTPLDASEIDALCDRLQAATQPGGPRLVVVFNQDGEFAELASADPSLIGTEYLTVDHDLQGIVGQDVVTWTPTVDGGAREAFVRDHRVAACVPLDEWRKWKTEPAEDYIDREGAALPGDECTTLVAGLMLKL